MKEWQKAEIRKGIESNLTFIESVGDFDEIDVHVYFDDNSNQLFDYEVDSRDASKAFFIDSGGNRYETHQALRSIGITGFDTVVRRFTAI